MTWSTDIAAAPRGKFVVKHRSFGKSEGDTRKFQPDKILVATKCGKVGVSWYLPEEKRWLGLAHGEEPVAWAPWQRKPYPEHPFHSRAKATKDNGTAAKDRDEEVGTGATGVASRPSVGGGTDEDDGRDVEAFGGAASVITDSPAADQPAAARPNPTAAAGSHHPGGGDLHV